MCYWQITYEEVTDPVHIRSNSRVLKNIKCGSDGQGPVTMVDLWKNQNDDNESSRDKITVSRSRVRRFYMLDVWKRCKLLICFRVQSTVTWLSRYMSCIRFDEPHISACLDGYRFAAGLKLRSVWVLLALELRSYQSKEILSFPGEGFPLLLTQKSWSCWFRGKFIQRILRIIP